MTHRLEVEVHAAAFFVALIKAGFLEEADSFRVWYTDEFGESETTDAWSDQLTGVDDA